MQTLLFFWQFVSKPKLYIALHIMHRWNAFKSHDMIFLSYHLALVSSVVYLGLCLNHILYVLDMTFTPNDNFTYSWHYAQCRTVFHIKSKYIYRLRRHASAVCAVVLPHHSSRVIMWASSWFTVFPPAVQKHAGRSDWLC